MTTPDQIDPADPWAEFRLQLAELLHQAKVHDADDPCHPPCPGPDPADYFETALVVTILEDLNISPPAALPPND